MAAEPDRFAALWIPDSPTARSRVAVCEFQCCKATECVVIQLQRSPPVQLSPNDSQALLQRIESRRVVVFARALADEWLRRVSAPEPVTSIIHGAVEVLDLALLACPCEPAHSFQALCASLNVPAPKPEASIEAYARALGLLFLALRRHLAQIPNPVLGELIRLTSGAAWPARDVLREILTERGHVLPAKPLNLATALSSETSFKPRTILARMPDHIDVHIIAAELSPGGAVSRVHPAYEHREGQVAMAQQVSEAFNNQEILLLEGGTGIGKSLAYLIPAIYWAVLRGEAVLISTNTKNLQEQLATRDIPLLKQCLDVPFNAVVLKGRANYICLRKLVAVRDDIERSLFASEHIAVAFLVRFVLDSPTGDLSELSGEAVEQFPTLGYMIDQIRSDADSCAGAICPWRRFCFLERARRAARNADLIIANHALTLTHFQTPILPDYDHVIFDEAHNLENVATAQFGIEVSSYAVNRLRRLLVGGRRRRGFVDRLQAKLQGSSLSNAQEISKLLASVQHAADTLGDLSRDFGASLSALGQTVHYGSHEYAEVVSVRIDERIEEAVHWDEVTAMAGKIIQEASSLAENLTQLAAGLGEIEKAVLADVEGLQQDVLGHAARWREIAAGIADSLATNSDENVSWFETGPEDGNWSLHCVPIHIGEQLCGKLWEHKKTVVLTSATLTVDGTFEHIRDRLGLNGVADRMVEKSIPSPFNYPEQLLMCVPTDIPLPNDPAHVLSASDTIASLAVISNGRTLALFTSNASLNAACEQVEKRLRGEQMKVLCQGRDGPRHALIERLRTEERVVVLGTKSFWEGVDVSGDALQCLVVARLPFAVPTDPVVEARSQYIERLGVNAMAHYYIPQAVMGFKQGIGRIIRSNSDRGVVFVLDKRLLLRAYGRRFLRSIPQGRFLHGPLQELLAETALWLSSGGCEGT